MIFLLQLIATPFAYGSIYLGPTGAMVTLAISYLFGKSFIVHYSDVFKFFFFITEKLGRLCEIFELKKFLILK